VRVRLAEQREKKEASAKQESKSQTEKAARWPPQRKRAPIMSVQEIEQLVSQLHHSPNQHDRSNASTQLFYRFGADDWFFVFFFP
jgi:hypothetical protein